MYFTYEGNQRFIVVLCYSHHHLTESGNQELLNVLIQWKQLFVGLFVTLDYPQKLWIGDERLCEVLLSHAFNRVLGSNDHPKLSDRVLKSHLVVQDS